MFSALPLGILIIDKDQGIICANKAFYSLFNAREEGSKGKHIQDFLQSQELENHIRCIQIDGRVRQVELHLMEPGVGIKALKVTVIALPIKEIANPVVLLILEDISERIKLEAQLVQSEKLSGIGGLASTIVHELGNPLSVMCSTIEYIKERLKGKEDGNGVSDEIDIVADSLKRMDELLKGLSELRIPESLRFEHGDIHKALTQVLTLISTEAKHRHVEVKADLAPNSLICWHEPRQMKQVFLNLLKNAIEAMPFGGHLMVRTRSSPAEGSESRRNLTIEISDTGTGISEEDLSLIFKPFYSTKKSGSGLGLPFCRRVIEIHHGTITVKSVKGNGATFTISIPSDRRGGIGNE